MGYHYFPKLSIFKIDNRQHWQKVKEIVILIHSWREVYIGDTILTGHFRIIYQNLL